MNIIVRDFVRPDPALVKGFEGIPTGVVSDAMGRGNSMAAEILAKVALAEAIQGGRLAGAGLDVVVDEPIRPDHPLAGLPNVLLTPHLGSVTEDGLMRMARAAAEEVLRVLQGEAPRYPVNPEALAKPNR